jgi:hypothetical protein
VDFSDKFFQASGIGRSRIRNTFGIALDLVQKSKLKNRDIPFYDKILDGSVSEFEVEKWIWEEDAESSIINALEKAEWNYDSKSVSLIIDSDYHDPVYFEVFDTFFSKLVEIADIAFVSSLPSDDDFAEIERERFNPEEMVKEQLAYYEDNLKKLKWL